MMTEAHEVVVNEDLEYIAQAERINDEGPRTIDLKPHAENRREIPVIKQEARKSLKGSKKDAQKSSEFQEFYHLSCAISLWTSVTLCLTITVTPSVRLKPD